MVPLRPLIERFPLFGPKSPAKLNARRVGLNSILVGLWLKHHSLDDRRIWLYDTLAGMTEPELGDVRSRDGKTFD